MSLRGSSFRASSSAGNAILNFIAAFKELKRMLSQLRQMTTMIRQFQSLWQGITGIGGGVFSMMSGAGLFGFVMAGAGVLTMVYAYLDHLQKQTWQSYLDLSKELATLKERQKELAYVYDIRESYRSSIPE